jgi:phosphatidate cytidylyltransferase
MLASRLAIAIPGIVLAIVVVAVGDPLFAAVVLAVALIALFELFNLLADLGPLRWAGYASVTVTLVLAWLVDPAERAVLFGVGLAIGLSAVAGLILKRREDVVVRVATTLFAAVYIGVPMGLLVATRELPHGAAAVANVLVGTWAFDTLSYAGGRLWGATPVAPRISPGKTLEGLLVGLAGGILAVWIAGLYMDWIGSLDSLVLGIVISVTAYVGDLFESLLKRSVGVKDSGRLLAGHGGVLDRFDAILFTAVAGYFATVWLT